MQNHNSLNPRSPESIFNESALLINKGAIPGCSIVLKDGQEQASYSGGYFSTPESPFVEMDTQYDVASITKLFTSALVLGLHEQGKLSVHDKGAEYLDNFKESELTILDLLTHKADFNVFLSKYRAEHPTEHALDNALMSIKPPTGKSEGVYYGNVGFIYLGKIIQQVTAKPLAQNFKQLFEDLSLNNTNVGPEIVSSEAATPPTEVIDGNDFSGNTHDETSRILGGIAGNAGVFSTSGDLVKFGSAWLDRRIFQSTELAKLVFRNYDESGTKPQALGWWMRYNNLDGEVLTPGVYSHTGFTGSMLVVNPGTDKVGSVTCNRTYNGRNNKQQRIIWSSIIEWAQSK